MDIKLSYRVEDYIINPSLIKDSLNSVKQPKARKQAVSQVFKLMELLSYYEKNPQDLTIKQNIKNIIQSNFLAPREQQLMLQRPKINVLIDPQTVYPLNKSGTFGILQRSCKIKDANIVEWQGKAVPKDTKEKVIQDFIDKIQDFMQKDNNQLGWIPNSKQYPYRLILIDANKRNKAIYLRNKQEAQNVRLHFLHKFKIRTNVRNLVNRICKEQLKKSYIDSFYQKLIQNQRMARKSMFRYSQQMMSDAKANFQNNSNAKLQKFSGSPSQKQYQSPQNSSNKFMQSMFRKSNTKSVYPNTAIKNEGGYDKNFLNSLLEKQDRLSVASSIRNSPSKLYANKMNFSVIYRLEQQYKKDMVQTWFIKMKNQRQLRKIRQKQRLEQQAIERQRQKTPSVILNNSYDRAPSRAVSKTIKPNPITVQFLSAQFMKMTDIYFKPIITVQLVNKRNKVLYEAIFNTFLKKRTPNLSYKMIVAQGSEVFSTANVFDPRNQEGQSQNNLKNFTLNIAVLDYLTNEQVIKQSISLKSKLFSKHTFISNSDKTVKFQIVYTQEKQSTGSPNKSISAQPFEYPVRSMKSQMRGSIAPQNMSISAIGKPNNVGNLLQTQQDIAGLLFEVSALPQQILGKLKKYWVEESKKKGKYAIDSKMKIVQILQLGEAKALSWWLGIDQQIYYILSLLHTAAQILGFKLIRAIVPIVKALKRLYSDVQQLVQSIISLFINTMDHYYMEKNFNRIFIFHQAIGIDQNCDFSSKIVLQMSTLERLVEIQCPILHDKFKRRNIHYSYIIFQYVYEMYSRNLPLKMFVEVWNFLMKNKQLIEMYLVLLGVWLVRHYELQLRNCRRTRQINLILESNQIINSQLVIRQLLQLKEKYFKTNDDLVSQIKNMFAVKPLEKVITQFYKRQTQKIDQRKQDRQIEKKTILRKFNNQEIKQFGLPIYPPKKYCFHIYFFTVPQFPGSLYLKAEGIQYQCIGFENKRYFIISEVNSPIRLQFIDNKSNQYSCQIQTIKGVNVFRSFLSCSDSKQSKLNIQNNRNPDKHIVVQYICGLLTDSQIDVFRKNRKFQHYLGSFMGKQDLKDQMLRPIQDTIFLKEVDTRIDKEDLTKKIKVLFSQGSRSFNQIQFYLRWIQSTPLTLIEKIELIKVYAESLSNQFFLSGSQLLQKMLIKQFIGYLDFPLTSVEFQCFYNDSSDCQFDCPKVIKFRFQVPNGKQVKLQDLLINYVAQRAQKYLYGDILIDDLLQLTRPRIQQQLGTITEGNMTLLFSSNGQLNFRSYRIKRRKNNKELYIEEDQSEILMKNLVQIMSTQTPQLLMTEVMPTFAKITTILDYVNTSHNKSIDITRTKEKKVVAETINILKSCQQKMSRVLPLRYYCYPQKVYIPFLEYYYDLVSHVKSPEIPVIYFNNTRSSLKTICTSKMPMHFSDHQRGENITFDRKLGLYGNMRQIPSGAQNVYFWTYQDQQAIELEYSPKSYVFINYGYGVFRWENCLVKGFRYKVKQRSTKQKNGSQPKKQYLVVHKNDYFFVRQYEIRMSQEDEQKIPEIQQRRNLKVQKQKSSALGMRSQKNNAGSARNMEFLSKFIG